jgi:predicted Zn-dependent peptidase
MEIDKILNNLKLTPENLISAKKRLKVHLLTSLSTIEGLASALGQKETIAGDWMEIFKELEQIEKTTIEDIRKVIKKYLIASNRTITVIDNQE